MKVEILGRVLILKFYRLINDVGGINSVCKDGMHVGFIDVDNIGSKGRLSSLRDKIKLAQIKFHLGDAYLFRSSRKNYHIIFLDKHSFGFWVDVLMFFSSGNAMKRQMGLNRGRKFDTSQFQLFSLKRGRFVLRITNKGNVPRPAFVEMISGMNNGTMKSYAHWKYMTLTYPELSKKLRVHDVFDRETEIQIEKYKTVQKKDVSDAKSIKFEKVNVH